MTIPYTLIRTSRKTIQISIDQTGAVCVRAPQRVSRAEIERFLSQKSAWIKKHAAAQAERYANRLTLTDEEIASLRQAARKVLPARTAHWAQRMGVTCAGVRITAAARRWGSCSARGSICYSWRVMLLPPELRDYIVVHELAHLRIRRHDQAFYAEVGRWMPDYPDRIAALRSLTHTLPLG